MNTFETLGDILKLFDPETRPDLFGPRKRGSTTTAGLESLDPNKALDEIEDGGPGYYPACRYFRLWAPELNGRVGAVRFGDLTDEQAARLALRHVPEHGPELYLDQTTDAATMPQTDIITIILGPGKDGALVPYTWHPGTPLAPFDGTAPLADVGVKLHNG